MVEISIVIPCFNHGDFLMEALVSLDDLIHSVKAEVIIVNDGSTDKRTLTVFGELEEKGWRIFHQENQGLASARNNGINASVGKYILALDSDNLVIHEFVQKAVTILNNDKNTDVVYSDSLHFGEEEFYNKVGEFDPCKLISDNYIDACAIYRRSVWEELNGYDPKMPVMGHEDWDFWVGAIMRGKNFKYLAVPGFKYRIRPDSMLRTQAASKSEENRKYIYKKYNYQLFESIRVNYNPNPENFKAKYINLLRDFEKNRIKNIAKLLLGKKIG